MVILINLIGLVSHLNFLLVDGRGRHGTSTNHAGVINGLLKTLLKHAIRFDVLTLQLVVRWVLGLLDLRDEALGFRHHIYHWYCFE